MKFVNTAIHAALLMIGEVAEEKRRSGIRKPLAYGNLLGSGGVATDEEQKP